MCSHWSPSPSEPTGLVSKDVPVNSESNVHTQVVPFATSVSCPPQDAAFEVVLVEWAAPTASAELGGTASVEGPLRVLRRGVGRQRAPGRPGDGSKCKWLRL